LYGRLVVARESWRRVARRFRLFGGGAGGAARCVPVLGLAAVVVFSGADLASGSESASIQAILSAYGTGEMIANSQTNPSGETWSWQTCKTDGTGCTAFPNGLANGQTAHNGQIAGTVGAPSETVFKAVASDGPVATSPVWHGNVTPGAPPSVVGALRANALVTPVAGTWSGGWDGDFDQFQLAACVQPNGTNCITLTDPRAPGGCPKEAAVIDPFFAGRYLRVADQRWGVNTYFAVQALGSPYEGTAWLAGPSTSVAVVGQIAPATGPREASCGPGPPFSATISRTGVATVRCALLCTLTLRAVHGRRTASTHATTLTRPLRPKMLRLPSRARLRLGKGPAVFTVLLASHTLLARRTITLR
jgi:hypothetical protein